MKNKNNFIWIILSLAFMTFANQKLLRAAETSTDWKFKYGVEERLRYEYKKDFDFNDQSKDNGSMIFQRLKLNTTVSYLDEQSKERVKFFLEGLDAQVGGYQIKPQVNQRDDFDLHQAYVQLINVQDTDLDFKFGRMEVKYGNGRLISQPGWSNRMRHFDGGIVQYHKDDLTTDLLYLEDVKYDDNNWNHASRGEFISGVYSTLKKKDEFISLYEAYVLPQIVASGDVTVKRYTVGMRLNGKLPSKIGWEIEFPYQFGTTGTKDIKAHAMHVDLTRGWEEVKLKPKMTFEYNHATGDKDPNDGESNTFNPLYQGTHEPYGILDFFKWQNMREVALKCNLALTEKFKIEPQVNFFWLESKFDTWVNSSGTVLRSKTSGDRGYHVGDEVSLRGYYELNKNVKLETGYAHFFSGQYVKDSGTNDDVDWFYTQFNFKY